MSTWRRLAVIGVLVLSACGDDGSGVSQPAGTLLDTQVEALRAAAGREDRTAAAEQLAQLRASIERLQAEGELSDSAASRIRSAAASVESQLGLLRAPTTTTTTTTTTIPPPDEDDEKGRGEGDGRSNRGNNRDRGGDESD